ncbi:MAG: inositol monophosphatase family protein [Steroidobacteraceae bacterium]
MYSAELKVAVDAANKAAEIIRSLYQRNLKVDTKADRSPVTEADVRAEEAIRAILMGAFPQHGFYGEETGQSSLDAESLWLVDPLDGTKSFVRDCPFFSTQIALMRAGRLVVGVSIAPVSGELACAEAGKGATVDGQPVRVSHVEALQDAIVSTGNIRTLASGERWPRFGELLQKISRVRGYGDYLHYHLLARGAIDAVIESDVNILDIAALAVIVREAGGTFTDLDGKEPGLETTSVLAANGALHASLRACLG